MVTWAVPGVNSCCYFISLRTGAKICGFIALVGCIYVTILSGMEMIYCVTRYRADPELNGWALQFIWELGFDIALQLIHMTTSCCLILAVYEEHAPLIRPWLFSAILMAVMQLFFINSLAWNLVYGVHHFPSLLSPDWIIFNVLTLVDDVYGWLVVFSYYRTIKTTAVNTIA